MTDRAGEPQSKLHRPPPEPGETQGPGETEQPTDAGAPPTETDSSRSPAVSGSPGSVTQSKFGPSQASGSFAPAAVRPAMPAIPTPPPPPPATPTTPAAVPPRPAAPPPPPPPAASLEPDAYEDELDESAPRPTLRELLRRVTPAMAILTLGSIGSALFLLRAMTSHTTPVGVLMSAGVVTALIFLLDTVILTSATYRASVAGESGRAFGLALLGGISAVICALALAGTLIMILVLNS